MIMSILSRAFPANAKAEQARLASVASGPKICLKPNVGCHKLTLSTQLSFASHRFITTMRMTLAVVVLMLLEEDSRIGIDLKGDNTSTEVVQRD